MIYLDQLPNNKAGETIVLFLRRHWLIPLETAVLSIALLVTPVGLYYFILNQAPWVLHHAVVTPLMALAASAFYLAVWVYSFSEFIDYYLDTWIVTNERIINIEQHGLFVRVASELNLSAVQDATSEVHGLISTVLDFGAVHIQTAAETTRFVFKQIKQPEAIRRQIVQLADQARARQRSLANETLTKN